MIPNTLTPLDDILRHDAEYWSTIASAEARGGFVLHHSAELAARLDPNHAGTFRAPEGSAPVIVAEVVSRYRALGVTPAAYVDALATPRDLPDHLLAAGFADLTDSLYGATDLLVYVGPDRGQSSGAAVEVVQGDAMRAAWASITHEDAGGEQLALLTRLHLAETRDPRVTPFLASVGGAPASRCLLFSHGGIGRVECVRTLSAQRGRGLAAAVVRAAVRASIAAGNRLTYLYAEQGGDAQRLYERLGFRTVAAGVMRCFVLER